MHQQITHTTTDKYTLTLVGLETIHTNRKASPTHYYITEHLENPNTTPAIHIHQHNGTPTNIIYNPQTNTFHPLTWDFEENEPWVGHLADADADAAAADADADAADLQKLTTTAGITTSHHYRRATHPNPLPPHKLNPQLPKIVQEYLQNLHKNPHTPLSPLLGPSNKLS